MQLIQQRRIKQQSSPLPFGKNGASIGISAASSPTPTSTSSSSGNCSRKRSTSSHSLEDAPAAAAASCDEAPSCPTSSKKEVEEEIASMLPIIKDFQEKLQEFLKNDKGLKESELPR